MIIKRYVVDFFGYSYKIYIFYIVRKIEYILKVGKEVFRSFCFYG